MLEEHSLKKEVDLPLSTSEILGPTTTGRPGTRYDTYGLWSPSHRYQSSRGHNLPTGVSSLSSVSSVGAHRGTIVRSECRIDNGKSSVTRAGLRTTSISQGTVVYLRGSKPIYKEDISRRIFI